MKLRLFKSLQFRLPALVLLGVIPTTIIAIAEIQETCNTLIFFRRHTSLSFLY